MYGTLGTATGVSTPHSASSLRPLVLNHGSLEHALLIPTALHYHASELRQRFVSQLPHPTDEFVLDEEPSSVPELLARFLDFLARWITKIKNEGKSQAENNPESDDDTEDEKKNGLQATYGVLRIVLHEFEGRFLHGNEVHAIAAKLPGTPAKRLDVIRFYFAARQAVDRPIKAYESALLKAATKGTATVYAVFGGQGNIEEYFDELRKIYTVYGGLVEGFLRDCAQVLAKLSRDPRAGKVYSKGLDVMRWLSKQESTPDLTYLVSAPVSFPLIGLVQLAHYYVACKILSNEPGELRDTLAGTTGHSQGVITAAAIASATSWDSFKKISIDTLTILFWIGCRSQQTYPHTSLAPSTLQDSINEGEGTPSPMLSIRGLSQAQVQHHVDITNTHLPSDRHIHISLINGARNVVVTGPPQSLYGLNLSLRKVKAPAGLDQNRVPFTERKVRFINRFLPISAPFHSPYLKSATGIILEDLKDITSFTRKDLAIPVYSTSSGEDLQNSSDEASIIPELVTMITQLQVHWEAATVFPNATHILDFGPGDVSGLGVLTHRNKDGTGVRIIIAGAVEGINNKVGYKPELFDRDDKAVKYAVNWLKQHGPKLVRTKQGRTFVDTKFSRLLGRPPIMVSGMTPTTVPWDFVAATMNAGYQIELAGKHLYRFAFLQWD
jgi:fatty acid synthase subunit beta, fungi type